MVPAETRTQGTTRGCIARRQATTSVAVTKATVGIVTVIVVELLLSYC